MMTKRQRELLEEVISTLEHPEKSAVYGLPFAEAAAILKGKLDEVKNISDYERSMKGI